MTRRRVSSIILHIHHTILTTHQIHAILALKGGTHVMRRRQGPLSDLIARVVGARLRALRQARRLTMVELTAASGVDAATISQIEHGKMVGTPECHARLSVALRVRFSSLYADLDRALKQSPQALTPSADFAAVPVH